MEKIAILTAVIIFTGGCVRIPQTVISVPLANGHIALLKAPKDTDLSGLKINFEKGTLSLDTYKARMNPDVINASAVGQVELINAINLLVQNSVASGAKAAVKP